MPDYPLAFPAFSIMRHAMTAPDFKITDAMSHAGDQHTQLRPGSRWSGWFELAPFAENTPAARQWQDFTDALRGRHGTFRVPPEQYRPTTAPAHDLRAANAGDETLHIRWHRPADPSPRYLTLRNNLYRLAPAGAADAQGFIPYAITPDLQTDAPTATQNAPTPLFCIARAIRITDPDGDNPQRLYTGARVVWEQDRQI